MVHIMAKEGGWGRGRKEGKVLGSTMVGVFFKI